MSIENTIPSNKNFLSQLKFRFFIKKTPTVNFFVQEANIPSIIANPVTYPNPFVNIPIPGDRISYEDLEVTFLVDEDLENYKEIYNWIRGTSFPTDYAEHKALEDKPAASGDGLLSDISLILLSSKDNPMFDIVFMDAFPYALSGMKFMSNEVNVNFIVATAKFKYTYYDINQI